MVKLKTGNSIVLGLSDENMKRLAADQPIKFNLKELGLQDIQVFIFNGRNEETMTYFLNQLHPKDIKTPNNPQKN